MGNAFDQSRGSMRARNSRLRTSVLPSVPCVFRSTMFHANSHMPTTGQMREQRPYNNRTEQSIDSNLLSGLSVTTVTTRFGTCRTVLDSCFFHFFPLSLSFRSSIITTCYAFLPQVERRDRARNEHGQPYPPLFSSHCFRLLLETDCAATRSNNRSVN